jgi:hypothetical protein
MSNSLPTLIVLVLLASLSFSANAVIQYDAVVPDKSALDRIYEQSVQVAVRYLESLFSDAEHDHLKSNDDINVFAVAGDGTCFSELYPEPAEAFTCSHGELNVISTLNAPDVKIPNSRVSFRNDLVISNSLSFEGQKSKIDVAGCISAPPKLKVSITFTNLEVDLFHYMNTEEYRTLSLIEQHGSHCEPIPELDFTALESPSSCKSLSLEAHQQANSVTVRVTVHHSKCTIGAWVAPVVVLALIIAALISVIALKYRSSR